jgi:hypothetical protein
MPVFLPYELDGVLQPTMAAIFARMIALSLAAWQCARRRNQEQTGQVNRPFAGKRQLYF